MNFIRNTIDNVKNNDFKNISDSLFCYEQGLEMGKEETLTMIVNNLVELDIDINTISQITDIPLEILTDIK